MSAAAWHETPGRRHRLANLLSPYLFVLPVLILFLLFRIGPALATLLLSFARYEIGGESMLVGLSNYQEMMDDPIFWHSVRVTVAYTAIALPLTVITALALALLVHQHFPGVGAFRAIFFLPYVTSIVMAAIIWLWILRPTPDGLLNSALGVFGLDPVGWLLDRNTVLPSLALMSSWKGFGYSMLILVAGLQAIPASYQEAAMVDGATRWQLFSEITLPLLKPVLFFVIVIELVSSFQVFDAIYVMTTGGPARASFSLVYMLYNQGFVFFDFGYAAAIGVFLFVAVFTVTIITRRVFGSAG